MFLDFLNSFSYIAPMIKFSSDAIFVFNETAEETNGKAGDFCVLLVCIKIVQTQ